jgi:alpha-galactosidase
MIKIAMIGAGSVVFSRNLTGDILGLPEFRDCTISYMDVDTERLEVAGNLCRKVARALGANPTIITTTDRRKALAGADFVINMVQIGGFDSTLVDFEIPRKYRLNFTIADTTGPGGLFRALRTYPMLSGMCKDMEDVCPRAFLLNYSNPMSMNMQTVFRTSSIRAVGLCHSVQGTIDQLMGYIGEKTPEISFTCAGINHMAFYLKIEKGAQDLYPRLFAAMNDPKIYHTNKIRFELMRRLGHFVTESSEHNAEYCAWFIPRGKESIERFDVPIDEYLRRCDGIVTEFENMKVFSRSAEEMKSVCRSHEYGSTIIRSIVTGEPAVIYGNMPNHGAIDNLPRTAIVEAPTLVDRTGLHFINVGELPPQLIGYMQNHITQHELFIRAAMEGRRDHVYQACMFDPLTAASMSPDAIVEMCDELIAAHGSLLPNLDAKISLVPTSGKTFKAVDPKSLRKSWDDAHAAAKQERAALVKHYIADWQVIGPFAGASADAVSLEDKSQVEDDFLKRADGTVDLSRSYQIAAMAMSAGSQVPTRQANKTGSWVKATAKDGKVDLDNSLGRMERAFAYAYTTIDSVHAREALFSCGSDDGIKVWLNGQVVHENEVGRGYLPAQDRFSARLKAGRNHLFIKIDNYVGGWGFGLGAAPANF